MKNTLVIVSLALAGTFGAFPATASILGDTVIGSHSIPGLDTFNDGSVVIVDDILSSEFTGDQTVVLSDAFGTKVDFSIRFNFYYNSISDTSNLFVYTEYHSSGNETYQMNDFTVTFSDLNDVDFPSHTIAGVSSILDSFSVPGQGVDVTFSGNQLVLEFDDFLVPAEFRELDFEIAFSDSITTPSVVPVPAAAPMALLGLGILALARRFRRKNS